MSELTKKALAVSLKKLLSKKELSKITISNITDECGVNRQTFYYHFKDRNFEANDGSARHELNGNLFVIPEEYKKKFHCAIVCTGAQAIIEVKPK